MNLNLFRSLPREYETIGDLFVEQEWFCYTLEDRLRPPGEKVPGETAIPDGSYDWAVTYSPRFRRDLPLLLGVPGFDGIRIHPGNTHRDTDGCILVGESVIVDDAGARLARSRAAFDRLFALMAQAGRGRIMIWSARAG